MDYTLFGILSVLSVINQLDAVNNPFVMGYNNVTAPAGTIRGTKENITAFSKTYEYFAYRGVRYGKGTGGANRFKRPIPVDKFTGVYNATEYTDSCPQPENALDFFNTTGDPMFHTRIGEDCLSLNIFTPTDGGKKKAVMVWIHGGGWVIGTGLQYFGGLLAPFGDVVYVAINFRLGPLGFFSTGDANAPGNAAYFDQLLALKWVKENIDSFGGDPDMMTIFGESAGGFDVMAHAISPLSAGKGMFKRVISQSGVAVSPKENPMSVRDDVPLHSKSLGFNLRCNDTKNPDLSDTKALVECIRQKSLAEILKYSREQPPDAVVKGLLVFAPTVDGDFLPVHPSKLFDNPQFPTYKAFRNVDFMVSSTSNDGSVLFDAYVPILIKNGVNSPFGITREIMNNLMLSILYPKAKFPGVQEAVIQEYLVEADKSNSSIGRRDELIRAMTDQVFVTAAISAAQTHASMNGTKKTWMMILDHDVPLFPKVYGPGKANHGGDIIYCFGYAAMADRFTKLYGNRGAGMVSLVKQTDRDLANAYMTYFTNFAKYGDPNGKASSSSPYPKWSAFTLTDKSYMVFGSNATHMVLKAKKNLRQRAAAFWLEYIPFVAGQTCPTPKTCQATSCPTLMDQYIGYLRITVGQAHAIIIMFATLTAVFGSLSLILLMACWKLRRNLKTKGSHDAN